MASGSALIVLQHVQHLEIDCTWAACIKSVSELSLDRGLAVLTRLRSLELNLRSTKVTCVADMRKYFEGARNLESVNLELGNTRIQNIT